MDSLVHETLYLADTAALAARLERRRLLHEARDARRNGRRRRVSALVHASRADA